MIKETITRIKLTASDGMILTNGKEFGKILFVSNADDIQNYYEITEEEYNHMKEVE